MSEHDRESIEAIIARANYQRSMVLGEILADCILFITRGIGKAGRAIVGLFSHKEGGRPVAGT
jgi:hypothetical protein